MQAVINPSFLKDEFFKFYVLNSSFEFRTLEELTGKLNKDFNIKLEGDEIGKFIDNLEFEDFQYNDTLSETQKLYLFCDYLDFLRKTFNLFDNKIDPDYYRKGHELVTPNSLLTDEPSEKVGYSKNASKIKEVNLYAMMFE